MDVQDKLAILADAAKYDVACTSSGISRKSKAGELGCAMGAGCCHSFTPDGRCITLLKVLMTNVCVYDCAYCVNRCSNEVPRAAFTPEELADLTIGFYRRNYIEGLFLSSGVIKNPDHTTELMIRTLKLLREEHRFRGYIHAKAVPGTSPELIDELGHLADRMSVNLELPSQKSLQLLCPQKNKQRIVAPMRQIRDSMAQDRETRGQTRRKTTYLPSTRPKERSRAFVPAGQSTQMIIGATPETDFQILNLSQALYKSLGLKRVFFSAYLPVSADERLPQNVGVQLNREHRLYQADWLLRFYRFDVSEIIDADKPNLEEDVDPKAAWALNHLDLFPVEVNKAPLEVLLRVPGIGPRGARSIVRARRSACLREEQLRKLGVAFKRARYFITCNGVYQGRGVEFCPEALRAQLASPIDGGRHGARAGKAMPGQLSLFGEEQGRASIGRGDKASGDRTDASWLAGSCASSAVGRMGEGRQGDAAALRSAGSSGESFGNSSIADSTGARAKGVLPASEFANVADGLFGWQRALQGQRKVPA